MANAWAHLPNAAHIDRILADVKLRPAAWDAARGAAARNAAWDATRNAARNALAALVAWDDCGHLLDLEPDALRLMAASDHHPAVLLLPACIALHTPRRLT